MQASAGSFLQIYDDSSILLRFGVPSSGAPILQYICVKKLRPQNVETTIRRVLLSG